MSRWPEDELALTNGDWRFNPFTRVNDWVPGPPIPPEPPRTLKPCGTAAAYQRHRHNNEAPCDACTLANAATRRRQRREAAARAFTEDAA